MKNIINLIVLTLFFVVFSSYADDSFDSFMGGMDGGFSKDKKEFDGYQEAIEKDFEKYLRIYNEEFDKYKYEISEKWKDIKFSTPLTWVEYSSDYNERKMVDFDKGEITLQIITNKSPESVKAHLLKTLASIPSKTYNDAYKQDVVAQRMENRLDSAGIMTIKDKPGNDKAFDVLLTGVKNPTANDIKSSADKLVQKAEIKSESAKEPNKNVVTLTVNFDPAVPAAAEKYHDLVVKYADKEDVRVDLVYAVIHSESNFNPMAKSHIPAYGLMQIVPTSAGIDAMKHVSGKKTIPSPSYLYKPENNVKLGAAYLHILYYKYFKDVTNSQNRLYCSIAAYNTGAGNVAYAVNGSGSNRYSVSKASSKINKMSPDVLYNTLTSKLKYSEARRYLQKVSSRMKLYN